MQCATHNQVQNSRPKVSFAILLVMVFVGLLIGCKSQCVYHPAAQSVILSSGSNYHTAFIEFDDQGEFLDPEQLRNAVQVIRTNNPVFLVTFFHGWKNNADFGNENLQLFTNSLQILSTKIPPGTHLVGVYVAWRGDPMLLKDPLSWTARQLSFWSRIRAAERVAGTSSTEALYALLQAANCNTNSKVVLMGHSMGALILEKALSQAFVSSILSDTNRAVRPPADLVLLINSAAPSIYARQLISMLGRWTEDPNALPDISGHSYRPPLIISATSKGDQATGTYFPISMWLSSQTESFQNYGTNEIFGGKQTSYYRRTSGNNKALISHEIKEVLPPVKRTKPASGTPESLRQIRQENILTNLNANGNPLQFVITDRKYVRTYEIEPKTNALNKTRYWVMRVPTTIIADHGDIFNLRDLGFIAALVRLSEVTESAPPPRLNRTDYGTK